MALGAVSPIACIEIRPVAEVDQSLRLNFMLTSPKFTTLKSSTCQRNGWLLGSILAMVTVWCGPTFVSGTPGGLHGNRAQTRRFSRNADVQILARINYYLVHCPLLHYLFSCSSLASYY